MPNKLTFEEVIEKVKEERAYQDAKWGNLEDRDQNIAGFLLVIKCELDEAIAGWNKNQPGRHSALAEINQIAATAIACMQKYGTEGN